MKIFGINTVSALIPSEGNFWRGFILSYFGILRYMYMYVRHYGDALKIFLPTKSIIQYMEGVWPGKKRGGVSQTQAPVRLIHVSQTSFFWFIFA
jgi:hypothetical protein